MKITSLKVSLEKVLNEMLTLAEKQRKKTIFAIGIAPRKRDSEDLFFPFIRESSLFVIGNVEVNHIKDAEEIVKIIDGLIDYILVDDEKKSGELVNLTKEILNLVKASIILTYKDNDAWVEATDTLISQFLNDCLGKKVLIYTFNNLSGKLALKLCERGIDIYFIDTNDSRQISETIQALNNILPEECPSKIQLLGGLSKGINFDVVVGFSIDKAVINIEQIKQFSVDTIIIDAGIGSISEDGIKYALENDFTILRLDMRAGLSGNIINIIETYDLRHNIYGKKRFNGFNIVAGGYFGLKGDVVVDSITNPSRIIGIADGKGYLLNNPEKYEERIKIVKKNLIQ